MFIRPCAAEDIPQVTAIYGDAVRTGTASFELDPPSETEMQRRRKALADGGHPHLVADIGGGVAGFAYAGPYRARPAYRSTVENSVYVSADCRGRGIGRELLASLIDSAEVMSFRQMIAVIGDAANLPSIRLHEAAGFAHVGTLRSVGWKHERWLDTVLMQRLLGTGDAAPSAFDPPL